MAGCVVIEMFGLPCSEAPSAPLFLSSPSDSALLKLVPSWEMLYLESPTISADHVRLCSLLG